jgi:hypothetical protein
MIRWEYKLVECSAHEDIGLLELEPIGKEGWELVLCRRQPEGFDVLIFKRPIISGE